MNSRERVFATFNNEAVDRPACWFGASSEFLEKIKKGLALDDEASC